MIKTLKLPQLNTTQFEINSLELREGRYFSVDNKVSPFYKEEGQTLLGLKQDLFAEIQKYLPEYKEQNYIPSCWERDSSRFWHLIWLLRIEKDCEIILVFKEDSELATLISKCLTWLKTQL